ncbi:MAG TPA: phenylalanine--tRNA ligase subunit beta [Candidatus Saccharimonadales bacterium]|nr:phenylalanine--tRNA ligase subunit beta [Candidatus Saccharimonadales bacterium]
MKVSLNAIRYAGEHYKTPDLLPDGADALVEKIGAQLGAVEEMVDYGSKFDGVIIVKVVACEKHPNADKLSLCRIDDGKTIKDVERGDDGLVQVVCGAPNVTAGMLAAWLPPGATVPSTVGKEPFVLTARELRSKKSNGMLASPKELGIGDSHEGLLVVDKDAKPGTPFAKAYRLEGEKIIDIENKMFTHRPDCFGLMGVTREIAGIQQKPFVSPDWYVPHPELPQPDGADGGQLPLTVTSELPELVPRFTALTMSNIEVKPSPIWLQIVLSEAGIRPINNVVDYTNFWMLETGQPLHAYDYDKVKALSGGEAQLVVRNPKPGEKIKLLNGKEIEPRAEAIMIATDKQLIGVGGIMGGSETEVDVQTKNIILECANFDMYSIRRTSMAHGLFTDAATRFTKGQSPLQNLAVLLKTADLLRHDAAGKIASQIIDDNHVDKTVLDRSALFEPVKLTADFVNTRLGSNFSAADMKQLLQNVEFKVEVSGDELALTAPFWRTDIEQREDVVEEIGRLYGYDRLPASLPKRDLMPAPKDRLLELKANLRARLAKAGANEVLTYSFVHGDLLDKAGQDKSQAFQIANALSPDLQYYRLSLTPSLLEKVHPNIKAGYDQFALFEIGKAHLADQLGDDGLPREDELLSVVVTAAAKAKKNGAAYYEAKKYLTNLVAAPLTIKPVPAAMRAYDITKPFDMNRTAFIYAGETFLGLIGEFRSAVRQNLKLPAYCAGFELDVKALQSVFQAAKAYVPLPRFPKVTQDITLKVSAELPYQELRDFAWGQLEKSRPKNTHAQLEPRDIFQRQDDKAHKQVTFRLEIASYERTLTDPEVNKLLDEVAKAAAEKFGAERV